MLGTVLGVWVHPDDEAYLAGDGTVLARKVRARRAQATQTDGIVAALGLDDHAAWVRTESFVEAE